MLQKIPFMMERIRWNVELTLTENTIRDLSASGNGARRLISCGCGLLRNDALAGDAPQSWLLVLIAKKKTPGGPPIGRPALVAGYFEVVRKLDWIGTLPRYVPDSSYR